MTNLTNPSIDNNEPDNLDDKYNVTVVTESLYSQAARQLFHHLWQELDERYAAFPSGGFTPEQVDIPGRLFLMARVQDQPVGCGVLIPRGEDQGEIRRLWVEPWARRRGVGAAILYGIESMARELGIHTLRLRLGDQQPEALALFRQWEYQEIDCWTPETETPFRLCLEKRIRG